MEEDTAGGSGDPAPGLQPRRRPRRQQRLPAPHRPASAGTADTTEKDAAAVALTDSHAHPVQSPRTVQSGVPGKGLTHPSEISVMMYNAQRYCGCDDEYAYQ